MSRFACGTPQPPYGCPSELNQVELPVYIAGLGAVAVIVNGSGLLVTPPIATVTL